MLDGPHGAEEVPELISLLTTNVTSFFREAHHFRALRSEILPGLVARARRGERIRLWSAGCSTGQEPVSIAIELLDLCPEAPRLDVRILATDIDRHVLDEARSGVYSAAQMTGIAAPTLQRHFEATGDAAAPEGFRTVAAIRDLISFRPLNLIRTWPMQGPYQVIFCRNVLIYFGPETQRTLFAGFARLLERDGHLFLGHSERVERPSDLGLEPAGTTTYRRTGTI
jgi:chemotaxis protein methyltransferase CheR